MTKTEREQFKAEFIVSDCPSLNEFCRQKKVSIHAVKDYCAKEHWVEQKNEHMRVREIKTTTIQFELCDKTLAVLKKALANYKGAKNITADLLSIINTQEAKQRGDNAETKTLQR